MSPEKVIHIINRIWMPGKAFGNVFADSDRFWFLFPPFSGYNCQLIIDCINDHIGPCGCTVKEIAEYVNSMYRNVKLFLMNSNSVPDFCAQYHLNFMVKKGDIKKTSAGTYILD